jgi:hypothetical protein
MLEIPTAMPPITRAAFRMYVAALLLFPVVGYFEPTEIPTLPPDAIPILVMVVVAFVVPFLGMLALVVYKAYRGRNWARLVLTAFTAGGALLYLEYVLTLFSRSPVVAIADAILTLAQLLAVALLFTGPSNAWYSAQRAQANEEAA